MQSGEERRAYRRSESFQSKARVSRDKSEWHHAVVCDLSGEGLKFQTDEQFDVGDVLWFEMSVTGFLTSLDFTAKGVIRHKDKNTFGASFQDLNPDFKIHIDEAMRNFGPKNIMY